MLVSARAPDTAVPLPTVKFQTGKGGGGTALGQSPETPPLWIKGAVDRRDHGGDQPHCSCSRVKRGGAPDGAPDTPRWCHRPPHGGAHRPGRCPPFLCCSEPKSGGHRPRGGGATRYSGGASPTTPSRPCPDGHCHRGGGAPDRAWRCSQGSTLSPVSPPFFTFRLLLCKCANTTK